MFLYAPISNSGNSNLKHVPLFKCDSKYNFTCNDGSCVKMVERCDNVPNCEDMSDEYDCQILMLDTHTYRKQYPPIADMDHHVDVKVGAYIINIGNFDDLAMTYSVKFVLKLKWYDHHLTYAYLKDDYHENMLGYEMKHAIWLPPLSLNNTEGNIWVSVDEPSSKVYILKEAKPVVAPATKLDEVHYYSGHENELYFTDEYEPKFSCSFDLACFPFDTQVCGMEVGILKL